MDHGHGLVKGFLYCIAIATALCGQNIVWPANQILPSFQSPAATLDFMVKNNTNDEWLMFTTLKGLVNRTKPRIYSYSGGEEGRDNWPNSLSLQCQTVSDNWGLITKYRSEIKGIVAYDNTVPDACNLATTIAAMQDGIAVASALVSRLTTAPYNLPILTDLRGRFSDKLGVYRQLFTNYWPQLGHRLLVCLNPGAHYGVLRDYASATSAAVVWLDPRNAAEKALLDSFLVDMPAGTGVTMGWWPEEASGITEASKYGLSTCASDFSENLTVFSGMSRSVAVKPVPPKPALKNKIYVAMILSDGDNLQFVEHRMKNWWDMPVRGSFPLSWTVSPAMLDAMPSVLNFYYQTATANDCLISGPSGIGYTYPNYWKDTAALGAFVRTTDDYMRRAGLRVVTIWNTITGGISDTTGRVFANNSTAILGITGMKGGGKITIYSKLPAQELNATYCYSKESTIMEITNAAANWNRSAPRFVAIQANPWQPSFQDLADAVANFKSDTNMVFVRADIYFQLMREAYGLPVEPSVPVVSPKTAFPAAPRIGFNQASLAVTLSGAGSAADVSLELYDVLGRGFVKSRGTKTVSLKTLPSGAYIAVAREGDRVVGVRCAAVK